MRDFLAVQLLLLGIVLASGGDTAAGSTAEAFAPLCTVFLETGVAVESAKKMTEAARQRVAEVEAQLNATLAAEEERHQEGGLLTAVARRLDIENATQARLQFSLARACSDEGVRPENASAATAALQAACEAQLHADDVAAMEKKARESRDAALAVTAKANADATDDDVTTAIFTIVAKGESGNNKGFEHGKAGKSLASDMVRLCNNLETSGSATNDCSASSSIGTNCGCVTANVVKAAAAAVERKTWTVLKTSGSSIDGGNAGAATAALKRNWEITKTLCEKSQPSITPLATPSVTGNPEKGALEALTRARKAAASVHEAIRALAKKMYTTSDGAKFGCIGKTGLATCGGNIGTDGQGACLCYSKAATELTLPQWASDATAAADSAAHAADMLTQTQHAAHTARRLAQALAQGTEKARETNHPATSAQTQDNRSTKKSATPSTQQATPQQSTAPTKEACMQTGGKWLQDAAQCLVEETNAARKRNSPCALAATLLAAVRG
ncbi:hypothetical protein ERJ75_001800300 [Trypanosoma vivax]|nr:hypothetical protein ERJ75_001800300 [Trypanosoma vivax]